MNIKVGSTVRYLRHIIDQIDSKYFVINKLYTVSEVDSVGVYVTEYIPFRGGEAVPMYLEQIKLIKKIKATDLSRKVYPKKIEKDGWLI